MGSFIIYQLQPHLHAYLVISHPNNCTRYIDPIESLWCSLRTLSDPLSLSALSAYFLPHSASCRTIGRSATRRLHRRLHSPEPPPETVRRVAAGEWHLIVRLNKPFIYSVLVRVSVSHHHTCSTCLAVLHHALVETCLVTQTQSLTRTTHRRFRTGIRVPNSGLSMDQCYHHHLGRVRPSRSLSRSLSQRRLLRSLYPRPKAPQPPKGSPTRRSLFR